MKQLSPGFFVSEYCRKKKIPRATAIMTIKRKYIRSLLAPPDISG